MAGLVSVCCCISCVRQRFLHTNIPGIYEELFHSNKHLKLTKLYIKKIKKFPKY